VRENFPTSKDKYSGIIIDHGPPPGAQKSPQRMSPKAQLNSKNGTGFHQRVSRVDWYQTLGKGKSKKEWVFLGWGLFRKTKGREKHEKF